MYKKSSSSVKFSSSINNLLFLFLLGFSIFIIYRYVKSLENEVKTVKNELVSLKSEAKRAHDVTPPPPICTSVEATAVCAFPDKIPEEENCPKEDMESVASDEIMKIVDQISEEEEEPARYEEEEEKKTTTEAEEDDDIVVTTKTSTENDLSKKTNDELKKILKEQGKNTKGTKAELIKRIAEEA